ncbi:MAG TPA: RNA 2',3'-cyclic phosphodiesterase [Candidatus Binatia bacterium]|nr:RNA 2',3'-cyclic phosphodiesterase [Candidatus Binatia bacterium]
MIRAFIAIEIDPAVLSRIGEATDVLRGKIPDIRWTLAANWHLTLKFLGGIEEKQVDLIGQALKRELSLFRRFTINAKGVGVFPDPRRPRVLWVGVEGKPLEGLAESVEIALAPLGFEKEKRVFTPHLTIGRWRESKRKNRELENAMEDWKAYDFGRSKVEEVTLFQSILKPAGAEYRPLRSVRLNA